MTRMTTNATRKMSQQMTNRLHPYLQKLELQMQEHDIAPAEVHTLGPPMQDEYVTVGRRIWHETSARCLDNEIRAARLAHELGVEQTMRAEIERHLRAAERAILWQERRNRGLRRALWASQVCCAVAVMALFAIWRAM